MSRGKIKLYYETLKHLKPGQFLYRLKYKLLNPKPDLRPAPALQPSATPSVPWLSTSESFFPPDKFRFLNHDGELKNSTDWNNPAQDKLWLYNLHYFDCLRQPGLEKSASEALIARWIRENPPGTGNGWEPYPLSLRIVNWIKWALAGNNLPQNALDSLAVQVRFLAKRLEYHLLANHLLANVKALVFAGTFFSGPEAEKWLETGIGIYRRELPEQILADGGHFELSPMYHSIILEDILDLINISREMKDTAAKMLTWLESMCHPDGEIAFFNDASCGIAQTPKTLFEYAAKLGIEWEKPKDSTILPESGYVRMENDKIILFADVGQVGPDYQPAHAQADTLSFELSAGGKRILVNSGTSCYGTGELRHCQRSTPSHNTLAIDGADSSRVWSGHRVAERAKIVKREFSGSVLTASHDGFTRIIPDCIHTRTWNFQGRVIRIDDVISGNLPGTHQIEIFWHFYPGLALKEITDYIFSVNSGNVEIARFIFPEQGKMSIEDGKYFPEFGKEIPNRKIIYSVSGKLPRELSVSIEVL